jgi:endonuclease I
MKRFKTLFPVVTLFLFLLFSCSQPSALSNDAASGSTDTAATTASTPGSSSDAGDTAGTGAVASSGYYTAANGLSGTKLKAVLHAIINKGLTRYDYDACWNQIAYINEDTSDSTMVRTIYTGWTIPKTYHGTYTDGWNREHVWAKSHGDFGTSTGPGTDLHHLLPCDVTVNSSRNNLDFDDGGTTYTDASPPVTASSGVTGCKHDGDSWEPRESDRGDVARIIFYMAVMYDGTGGYDSVDLEINNVTTNETEPYIGKLSTLLEWSEEDPVDAWEQRRNERTYERQGNRNPFIDHPEWAGLIWK